MFSVDRTRHRSHTHKLYTLKPSGYQENTLEIRLVFRHTWPFLSKSRNKTWHSFRCKPIQYIQLVHTKSYSVSTHSQGTWTCDPPSGCQEMRPFSSPEKAWPFRSLSLPAMQSGNLQSNNKHSQKEAVHHRMTNSRAFSDFCPRFLTPICFHIQSAPKGFLTPPSIVFS